MSITLACTWRPHGELARLERLRPALAEIYARMVVSVPADTTPDVVHTLETDLQIAVSRDADPRSARHAALQQALETAAGHIHYADLDRALHWVETRPAEMREVAAAIQTTECLIIGRTPAAVETHPQSMQQTEAIVNAVGSYLLGQPVDLGGGSRGFSRRAVEFLLAHSRARILGTDAEWPILLHRAGFPCGYRAVDGLEWETADRYQDQAANLDAQHRLAEQIDADPARWAWRVLYAREIVEAALEAMSREL
jgi:hypothetical protein